MQTTTVPLQLAAVALLATTMACSGASDALGSIGEPIPMGTAVVPSIDVQAWQPSSPVPLGTSQTIGNVTLSVTNVIRPANHIADDASFYSEPDRGKEFVAVDVTATCNLPSDQACSLTTADFGAEGSQGNSYHSEIVVSGVRRAFESGELTGGKSRSGFLLFLVDSDDRGLVMRFPQMFGFAGQAASFSIDG